MTFWIIHFHLVAQFGKNQEQGPTICLSLQLFSLVHVEFPQNLSGLLRSCIRFLDFPLPPFHVQQFQYICCYLFRRKRGLPSLIHNAFIFVLRRSTIRRETLFFRGVYNLLMEHKQVQSPSGLCKPVHLITTLHLLFTFVLHRLDIFTLASHDLHQVHHLRQTTFVPLAQHFQFTLIGFHSAPKGRVGSQTLDRRNLTESSCITSRRTLHLQENSYYQHYHYKNFFFCNVASFFCFFSPPPGPLIYDGGLQGGGRSKKNSYNFVIYMFLMFYTTLYFSINIKNYVFPGRGQVGGPRGPNFKTLSRLPQKLLRT